MRADIEQYDTLISVPQSAFSSLLYYFYELSGEVSYSATQVFYADASSFKPTYGAAFNTITSGERAAISGVLSTAFAPIGLSVNENATLAGSDFAIGGLNHAAVFGGTPVEGWVTGTIGAMNGDIWLADAGRTTNFVAAATALHEFGHRLGLYDAGNTPVTSLPSGHDQQRFTIMSYNFSEWSDGFTTQYMTVPVIDLQIYDIATLQYIYGQHSSYNSGNTSYNYTQFPTLSPSTDPRQWSLWDGGGIDVIDASDFSNGVYIDLRPGHFSSIGADVGVLVQNTGVSSFGKLNFSIAFGADIEQGAGSSGNDFLVGNIHSNVILGNDGDDHIYGDGFILETIGEFDAEYDSIGTSGRVARSFDKGDQEDSLDGGDGNDSIFASAGGTTYAWGRAGNDILWGVNTIQTLTNAVVPSFAADGGDGDDQIVVGAASNYVGGGTGNDWFFVQKYTGGYQYTTIFDSDPGDNLIWNGHRLTGGLWSLLEGEFPIANNSEYTTFQYEAMAFVGQYGEYYRYAPSIGELTINTPDGAIILVEGFVPGDMGITLGYRSSTGGHESTWFWTNIVNDGIVNNYGDLEGAAEALATPGPYHVDFDRQVPPTGGGGSGPDTYQGGGGPDSYDGGGGDDTILGGGGDDELAGGDGDDLLDGEGGHDTLAGGAGDDVIHSGSGQDQIIETAGGGVDRLIFASLLAEDAVLSVTGSDLTISFTASSATAKIMDYAGAGDAGIELYEFSDGSTLSKSQVSLAATAAAFALGSAGAELIQGGSTAEFIAGFDGDDSLYGGDGNDVIHGGGGHDELAGDEGDDTLDGGDGYDTAVWAGDLADYSYVRQTDGSILVTDLVGSEGTDTLRNVEAVYFIGDAQWRSIEALIGYYGTEGSDGWIAGSTDADRIFGLAGADTLFGDEGDDELDGGDGFDVAVYASSFTDLVFSRNPDGSVKAVSLAEGEDVLTGIEAVYSVDDDLGMDIEQLAGDYGTSGNDPFLAGTEGNDNLYGLAGDDELAGYEGDDLIDGGDGDDQAIFYGAISDYTFVLNMDGSVTATSLGEGVDTLVSIEAVYFVTGNTWSLLADLI